MEDALPVLLTHVRDTEELAQFLGGNRPRVVRVEQLEGLLQAVLLHEGAPVHRDSEELAVVNVAVPVEVNALKDLVHLLLDGGLVYLVGGRALEPEVLAEALDELAAVELAVAVLVHLAENGSQVVALLARDELGANVEQRRLGELLRVVEGLHVVDGELQAGQVNRVVLGHVGEPVVLQRLGGGDALRRVEGDHATDEVLGALRDLAPLRHVEGELARLHLLDDRRLVRAVEGREAAQQNVQDHADGPDVALVVVHALEHLGRNVVRRADLLLHLGVDVAVRREAKVNDPDVGVDGLGLEQQVLRLEVAVHDVLPVHVVDAAQHLLDDFGRVLLREALAAHYLVEQLASRVELRDEVVVLFVLEELEDLHDVRVVQRLEHVHLAQQRLVVALALHGALNYHLHGVLLAGGAVEAQQHLAEGALAEQLHCLVVLPERAVGAGDEHAWRRLQRRRPLLASLGHRALLGGGFLGIAAQSSEFVSHTIGAFHEKFSKTHLE
ncbi:ABC transporter ATP-binding protein, putative [Babesia caballi]|uniref:ABC transporter ATP-binding protein, putative n=1 Tax=Babesia caballi TaxID=5871 RepID=A0AAV4LZN7_BABCB|nr:ABC transporter ATP-binding protein, putative [Babesia caballi]